MAKNIIIKGARVHNLKNVDIVVPRDKLVVFTGLSGSGKSSLAFDTLYAEGHRRFVESLSSYARMFLGQMDKPDVDSIEGLSPAISLIRKPLRRIPARRWVPLPKSTTICDFSMPASACRTVRSAARRSVSRPPIRSLTAF